MNKFRKKIVTALATLFVGTTQIWAQFTVVDHSQHEAHGTHHEPQTLGPLNQLEIALQKNSPKMVAAKKTQIPPMAQNTMEPPVSGISPQKSSQGMGGGGGMMGMMNRMMGGPMPSSQMPAQTGSELPGFPGASHIYHIGATGFFVDQSRIANFSVDQLTSLNKIMEQSLLNQASLANKIEQANGELWMLTASDQPNMQTIEIKIREIESLKSNQRISFIRDIGKAASVLSPEQRTLLLGTKTAKAMLPDAETTKPAPAAAPSSEKTDPSPSQPMGDM